MAMGSRIRAELCPFPASASLDLQCWECLSPSPSLLYWEEQITCYVCASPQRHQLLLSWVHPQKSSHVTRGTQWLYARPDCHY